MASKIPINHFTFTSHDLLQKSFALSVWEKHRFKMVCITIVLILAVLSMETLASPLNLEVSIKGVQNGNTTNQSAESCLPMGEPCPNNDANSTAYCKGMSCHNWNRECFPPPKKQF